MWLFSGELNGAIFHLHFTVVVKLFFFLFFQLKRTSQIIPFF